MSNSDSALERMFFASVPDREVSASIAEAGAALQLCPEAQRVPSVNHHLTLAFIGAVPTSQALRLHDVGGRQRCEPFTLRFDAYEYWPKPAVVVAAARFVPAALEGLWQRLHAELAVNQWALKPKRLRPHITLAKNVLRVPVLPVLSAFDWSVSQFSLVRSESRDAESAYTVVSTWSLLDTV